ncbi:MAG: hypothetical protein OXH38_06820 [Chloroflexi bacterium]|nr:hypothetical protein [Chloroflexota bacterium]
MADASVIINLNATASAAAIIGACHNPFLVTPNVLRELSMGESHGHRCGERLEALIGQGLVELSELTPSDDLVYRSLIEGGFEGTLDDGEASTIAYAVGHDGIALIDENKARRICAARFPSLPLVSTVEMLLDPLVAERLGEPGQSEAIFLALRDGRMQVPRQRLQEVIDRIGVDRAAECPSLPRSFRDTETDRAR